MEQSRLMYPHTAHSDFFSRFIAEEISSHLLRKMRTVKGETKEENVQSAPLHENIRIQQGGAYGLS